MLLCKLRALLPVYHYKVDAFRNRNPLRLAFVGNQRQPLANFFPSNLNLRHQHPWIGDVEEPLGLLFLPREWPFFLRLVSDPRGWAGCVFLVVTSSVDGPCLGWLTNLTRLRLSSVLALSHPAGSRMTLLSVRLAWKRSLNKLDRFSVQRPPTHWPYYGFPVLGTVSYSYNSKLEILGTFYIHGCYEFISSLISSRYSSKCID